MIMMIIVTLTMKMFMVISLWRSVRSCSQTIPEALAKIWRAAGSKVKAFSYMVRTLRSIAFQRCIWRGGPPLVEMAENEGFLQKKARKTGFFSIAILDHLTSERAGTPNFKSLAILDIFHEKCGPLGFKWAMGRHAGVNVVRSAATWIFFGEYREKMQKRAIFCI